MKNGKHFLRLLIAATFTILLVPIHTYAWSLGAIKIKSALGQPFNASISLQSQSKKSVENECQTSIISMSDLPSLSSPSVKILDNNLLTITTRQRIYEPILGMRVRLICRSGITVEREYTLLLDPVGMRRPKQLVKKVIKDKRRPLKETQPIISQRDPDSQQLFVQPGDSLSEIIYLHYQVKDKAHLQQISDSIIRENPRAFPTQQANNMMAGVWMTLTDSKKIKNDSKRKQLSQTASKRIPAARVSPALQILPPQINDVSPELILSWSLDTSRIIRVKKTPVERVAEPPVVEMQIKAPEIVIEKAAKNVNEQNSDAQVKKTPEKVVIQKRIQVDTPVRKLENTPEIQKPQPGGSDSISYWIWVVGLVVIILLVLLLLLLRKKPQQKIEDSIASRKVPDWIVDKKEAPARKARAEPVEMNLYANDHLEESPPVEKTPDDIPETVVIDQPVSAYAGIQQSTEELAEETTFINQHDVVPDKSHITKAIDKQAKNEWLEEVSQADKLPEVTEIEEDELTFDFSQTEEENQSGEELLELDFGGTGSFPERLFNSDIKSIQAMLMEVELHLLYGETEQAEDVLQLLIKDDDASNPDIQPWNMLFDLFRHSDDKAGFDELLGRFTNRYNVEAPRWDENEDLLLETGLEARYPWVLKNISDNWNKAGIREMLNSLLIDDRSGDRAGFEINSADEISFLRELSDFKLLIQDK